MIIVSLSFKPYIMLLGEVSNIGSLVTVTRDNRTLERFASSDSKVAEGHHRGRGELRIGAVLIAVAFF